MKITILTIGKRHEPWVEPGIKRFLERLRAPFAAEMIILPHSGQIGDRARQDESERLMSRLKPHDFVILPRDWLHPKQVYNLDDFPLATKSQADTGVTRNGKKVTVRITSVAPAYEPTEFNVKVGDEVTLILTNLDKVEDLTHGFAIPEYNIQFIVNPQETKSVTFKIDKPGVFWYYCTNFCHALHLEMRGRMIVEP